MKAVYRNNIILRMGGEPGFNFLVATYCENIQDDERLNRFFGNFDLNTLMSLQKEFLLVSFLEPYEETEPRKKRVMFRNDMMGIDGSIFPSLEKNFVDALEDCCIGGLDFELCKAYFSELHALFKDSTEHSKYRENIVQHMGGEPIFDFLVLTYCERLEDDERLNCYFEELDSDTMTSLQKELILMAFLQPNNADNDFGALRQRVTSAFSPLFELGMSEEHFKMMERHFSAAVYDCLTGPAVIQSCLRLFGNLITFFEDNLILSNREYGENEEESEFSETEFDEEDDDSSVFSDSHNDDSSLPDNVLSLHSSDTRLQRRGSILLDEPYRPVHLISVHSRRILKVQKKDERGASYVSKRIQDVLDRSPELESEKTDDTLSMCSEQDSKAAIQPASPVISPKLSTKGRPKLAFSWKKRSWRNKKKVATVQ